MQYKFASPLFVFGHRAFLSLRLTTNHFSHSGFVDAPVIAAWWINRPVVNGLNATRLVLEYAPLNRFEKHIRTKLGQRC